ncbi:hypothetical protein ACT3UD_18390 [Glutamicibacter sp. 287]|uniref:hypothetical protein n=1 Tax=Glutamicibacter sp. 287 TaxID=3457732 RepID=UPI000BB797C0|nr:hypothetical protein CIK76_05215 [Glutamicibacter sp. BW80]
MITATDVIGWLELRTVTTDDFHLSLIVPAVNAYVESLPSIDRTVLEDGSTKWAGTTQMGAVMLASRLYRRKNSPHGIESVGDMSTYVSRYDSDISRLLNIDTFRKPLVG